MWTTSDLNNESDVEQKFLYPFLIEPQPIGLGLPPTVVQTKVNIRWLAIGKGADQKIYYPDYLVLSMGYSLLVTEAKHPSQSLDEGFREARLYASELTSLYDHKIAPAKVCDRFQRQKTRCAWTFNQGDYQAAVPNVQSTRSNHKDSA
jgi:hypothetical protein